MSETSETDDSSSPDTPDEASLHAGSTLGPLNDPSATSALTPGAASPERGAEPRKRGRANPNSGHVNTRATKAQIAQRLGFIVSVLVAGERRAGVLRAVAEVQRQEAQQRADHNAGVINNRLQPPRRTALPPHVWGDSPIPERTVDYYITKATTLIEDAATYHNARELGRSLLRQEDLFARAFRDKQWAIASVIEKRRAELLGLGALGRPQRVELTGLNGGPIETQEVPVAKMTEQQRADTLEALLAKARQRAGVSAGAGANGSNGAHN